MVDKDAPQYVPPYWPAEVSPPGTPDWEASTAARLLDLVPEYRQHALVWQHLVTLAFMARHTLNAMIQPHHQAGWAPCSASLQDRSTRSGLAECSHGLHGGSAISASPRAPGP